MFLLYGVGLVIVGALFLVFGRRLARLLVQSWWDDGLRSEGELFLINLVLGALVLVFGIYLVLGGRPSFW